MTFKGNPGKRRQTKTTWGPAQSDLSAGKIEQHTVFEYMPEKITLATLRQAAAFCQACDLFEHATQTVFGDGNSRAKVMFIGEQPGDMEDKEGEPFVGPAGKLLRKAMHEAGIEEKSAYFTNVVKHFKFEERGKRRIHAKPRRVEVLSCLPWLQAEIQVVKPQIIVLLGATAAQSLLGSSFRITKQRGQPLDSPLAPHMMATVHPSSILRAPDDEKRHLEMLLFVEDLKKVAALLKRS